MQMINKQDYEYLENMGELLREENTRLSTERANVVQRVLQLFKADYDKLLEYNVAIQEAEVDLTDDWEIFNVAQMSDVDKVKQIINRVDFAVYVGSLPVNKSKIDIDKGYKKIADSFISEELFSNDKTYNAKDVYFVLDMQGGNLGNIENDIFLSIDDIIARLSDTYFADSGIYLIDNLNLRLSAFTLDEYKKLTGKDNMEIEEKDLRLKIEADYSYRTAVDDARSLLYAYQDSIEPDDFAQIIDDDDIMFRINTEIERLVYSDCGEAEQTVLKDFVNFIKED